MVSFILSKHKITRCRNFSKWAQRHGAKLRVLTSTKTKKQRQGCCGQRKRVFVNVGRLGGDQLLCLDDNVNLGTAVHEIGHVLWIFSHTAAV
ncbi:hypothetical protein KIN20_012385 [Parelaphostrongylus tenuis]|uniref:Uncharacterized protein n=1 Tax=Parelaphostrongylus tenuis TaxID=148309 RepID=A0AAD5MAM3_PARTN|nr:hypothetical protein KIN20_012385 [Parelaphostrongylus tenuis]